jgi:hypothetical protein
VQKWVSPKTNNWICTWHSVQCIIKVLAPLSMFNLLSSFEQILTHWRFLLLVYCYSLKHYSHFPLVISMSILILFLIPWLFCSVSSSHSVMLSFVLYKLFTSTIVLWIFSLSIIMIPHSLSLIYSILWPSLSVFLDVCSFSPLSPSFISINNPFMLIYFHVPSKLLLSHLLTQLTFSS